MSWNFGDNKSSNLTSPTHHFLSSGVFDVKLVAVSKRNCTDSITKSIFVNPSPVASFILNEDTLCLKTNITFINKSTINNGKLDSIIWNVGDGKYTNSDTIHHIYSAPGNYKVQLQIKSDSGCTDTISHLVVVYPVPLASFYVNDTTQCINGNSYAFNNSTVISPLQPKNSTRYEWYFGDGKTDSNVNPSHTYLKVDTFQSRIIAIVNNSCRDTFDQKIFVFDLPIADFAINDTSQCLIGNHFIFINNSTIKSSIFFQKWEFADGFDTVSYDASHSYSLADSYMVKLIIVTDSACKDSIIKQVIVNHEQTTDFAISDTSVCIGELIQFNNSSSYNYGTLTFNWNFGDGNNTGTQNPQHSYITDSTFNVKLVSLNNFGCKDSVFHKVYINPFPKTGFTINDTAQCLSGNSFTFTDNSSIKSGSIIQNYFDFGDGSNSLLSPVTHTYLTVGAFLVKLVSKSDQGCSDSLNKTVYLRPMPIAGFTINTKTQNLAGNNFIFTSTTVIPTGNLKYYWDFGDGDTSTNSNSTHSYTAAGSYKVKIIATSGFGCADTFSDSVFVLSYPKMHVSFSVQNACVGEEVLFKNYSTISPPDSFLNFLWNFGDGATIVKKEPKHIYAAAGKYTIRLSVLTAFGSKDSLTDTIEIFADPVVNITASPDTIVIPGNLVTLIASGLYDQLLWFDNSTAGSVNVTSEGTYWVTASYNNGCKSSDTIILTKGEIKKPEMVNVITPNGDGFNDLFVIKNIASIKPCKLAIYNRWGDELFSTSDYQNNWDGTYKGKKLPEGTYYYVLETRDGKVYKGAVNVLK
jgi:gliding motility-associated-like protein